MTYYGFYDFILNELFKSKKKDFKLFNEFLKHSQTYHQVYIFKDICFISDFPKEIHRNTNNDLHNTNKPALLYRDTYALYKSNGITMEPKHILTPAIQITKKQFLSEPNADQRRELTRKIGMQKLIELLNPEVLDKMNTPTGGEYRLLSISYDGGPGRPYLQMKCPSTKYDHIIGVKPGTTRVKDAWKQLNNIKENEKVKIIWET